MNECPKCGAEVLIDALGAMSGTPYVVWDCGTVHVITDDEPQQSIPCKINELRSEIAALRERLEMALEFRVNDELFVRKFPKGWIVKSIGVMYGSWNADRKTWFGPGNATYYATADDAIAAAKEIIG